MDLKWQFVRKWTGFTFSRSNGVFFYKHDDEPCGGGEWKM